MKVFLDDERVTPQGWTRAYWPAEVIALLRGGEVDELSLDHDLGDDIRGTGYDVICWIEKAVAMDGFIAPKITVHSANSSARLKMLAGVRSIEMLSVTGKTLPAWRPEGPPRRSDIHCTTAFDERFVSIPHFHLYPEMMPWVGSNFAGQRLKILIVGESHYLAETSTCHQDATAWYLNRASLSDGDRRAIRTRGTLGNTVTKIRKASSSLIYRNIDSSLRACALGASLGPVPFASVAFMNYFQRPANARVSIRASVEDLTKSFEVFSAVLDVLEPDAIIFCSRLAWRAAHTNGIERLGAAKNIRFASTVHPATRWWHTPMKKYSGRSGRQMFEEAIQDMAQK